MGAPSKRARKIRTSDEFNLSRLSAQLRAPQRHDAATSWTIAEIVAARDLQMAGRFERPARLVESMRTDDALFVAAQNRLAPARCIPVELRPAGDNTRARSIASEAAALWGQEGVGVQADTIADINGCLVDHGVAFGYNVANPRADGSRVDFEHHYWPIDAVRWDPIDRAFKTRVDSYGLAPIDGATATGEIPIVHGDGRWTIYRRHEHAPWKADAAILSAALVWARHAYALRDWSKGSTAHGNAKIVGELPEGMPLQGADGGLTPEAAAFLELLRTLASVDSPYGVRPSGSKTEILSNSSSAWQVWDELAANAEKAAARIYLGTDGTLGANGGAPGVDIASLFGVAATKVEGDLRTIERCFRTGVIEPWCAVNFGDSALAPRRVYLIPDGDQAARHKSAAEQNAAYLGALKTASEAGIVLTPEYVAGLAKDFGVRVPAPAA